ncbi:MAG: hypothetical protein EPN94_10320 [Nitrospirae bacterium]|nr:MAG: hypothetical protein EPN94_10320 [Nitrospirota bacterium]
MGNRKYSLAIIFILLFAAGITGGYLYFSKKTLLQQSPVKEDGETGIRPIDDLFTLRVYYPVEGRLQMEERKVQRKTAQMSVAEAVLGEFFKGPVNAKGSGTLQDTKLLGLYKGSDGILYVDLSDEFRRNFSGDAASEFLLLKGFYESLISNVQEISDVKVLIEGKEIESLGGHINLRYPLKDTVSSDSSDLAGRTGIMEGADKGGAR